MTCEHLDVGLLGSTRAMRALALCGAFALAAALGTACSDSAGSSTKWLCRPGLADNPCDTSLSATAISSTGVSAAVDTPPAAAPPPFDCFYAYPTVSADKSVNSDLSDVVAETSVAKFQASRFAPLCQIWAPLYRQTTVAALGSEPGAILPTESADIAFRSLAAAFDDYLDNDNSGRPIVFIGHSQGAAMLMKLIAEKVDNNPSLRDRMVLAILLGGNVEVREGSTTGGTFANIPLCDRVGQTGCVIAYSSFPGVPPGSAVFGRPGRGLVAQGSRKGKPATEVACVNPAAIGGGAAPLDPFFLSTGNVPTPWVEYPGLYTGECKEADGATWLDVTKATDRSDTRPVVTEDSGPDLGYHAFDMNLALGNLVAAVAAAESSWTASHN